MPTQAWKRPPLLPFTPFSAFELNNTLRRVLQTKADLASLRSGFAATSAREFTWQPVAGLSPDRRSDRFTTGHCETPRRALDVSLPTPGSARARVAVVDKGQRTARSISD